MVLFVTFDIFLKCANHCIQNTGSKVRVTFKKEHNTEQHINIQNQWGGSQKVYSLYFPAIREILKVKNDTLMWEDRVTWE